MSNTDNTSNTFTPNQLSEILDLHVKWLRNEPGGVRANLTGADMTGADMTGSILEGASLPPPVIDLAGTKVGYKKVWNNDKSARVVIELRFPEGSKLVSTVIGRRKCRASKAEVVRCVSTGFEQEMEFQSMHDRNFVYRVGETVKPRAAFDDSITVECTSGIHFFVTREEAEAYSY